MFISVKRVFMKMSDAARSLQLALENVKELVRKTNLDIN